MARGLRLLICTQAVDRNDPILGFFHSWIEEFAERFEHIHVVCLKEGDHHLPKNVSVHSLGKESNVSRAKYILRFYRYIFSLQKEYDAVFVHMNQEYLLLGGKFWRIFGKRTVLWRNHKKGSILTRIAALFAHVVCCTSPEAYVAKFRKAVQMPIGIDTISFKLGLPPSEDSILFLGRLDAVKNPDIFLEAIGNLRKNGISTSVHIYGDPTPGRENFATELKKRFVSLSNLSFHPAVLHAETAGLYSRSSIFVNLTPSGSFDKTIGEAMASGCIVVVANEVVRGILGDALIVDPTSAESTARGIMNALRMDKISRERLRDSERKYVEREHSLSSLAEKLAALYKGTQI